MENIVYWVLCYVNSVRFSVKCLHLGGMPGGDAAATFTHPAFIKHIWSQELLLRHSHGLCAAGLNVQMEVAGKAVPRSSFPRQMVFLNTPYSVGLLLDLASLLADLGLLPNTCSCCNHAAVVSRLNQAILAIPAKCLTRG
eukprot:1141280-Pelagomonas_calceolata.AAC.1